ncbi:MAG: NACHT domain-containing protein, partial [Planktothrix sp.]
LKQFQAVETQLRGSVTQQQAFFNQISHRIESGFAEVCQQLGVMETTITGWLQILEERLEELSQKMTDFPQEVQQEFKSLHNQPGGRQFSKQEYRSRQNLLTRMRNEVESRLTLSIPGAEFVNLGKEEQPQQVEPPWVSDKVGEQRSLQFPPQTTILDVFDNSRISGKFLILGKPGGGKTRTLLDLAKALIQRAEKDSDTRIPVILELSRWQDVAKPQFWPFGEREKYDPSIKEWVLSELMSKGVSQKIGEQWLDDKELILLLDGLDELPSERQAKCVLAINKFLTSEYSPQHLVVCSCKEEYENHKQQLGLNTAICLKDLTVEQMQYYFYTVKLGEFWDSIKGFDKIVNFIRQPLFLAVTSRAYDQMDVEEWRNCKTEERNIEYLLGAYIVQMLEKKQESKLYDDPHLPKYLITQNRLIKLAKIYELNFFSVSEINLNILNCNFQKIIINIFALLPFFLGFLGVCFALNLPFLDIGRNILCLLTILVVYLCFASEFKKNISTKLLKTIAPQFSFLQSFKLVILIDTKTIFINTVVETTASFRIAWARVLANPSLQLIWHYCLKFLFKILSFLLVFFLVIIQKLPLFFVNPFLYWMAKIIIGIIVATIVTIFLYPLRLLLVSPIVFIIILGLELYNFFRRWILRLILGLTGQMPWNITRFLNYCTEHLILQRVGKRYRFIHRLVQEHFANLPIQNK